MTCQTGSFLKRPRRGQQCDNKLTVIATTLGSKPHFNIFLEDFVVSVW